MHMRPAKSADAARIQSIATAAYTPYVAAIGRPPAPMTADFPTLIRQRRVWMTEREEAFIVLFARESDLFVENLAVHPDHAGNGIARALMGFAKERAQLEGRSIIRLYTNEKMAPALRLYPRLGFVETHRAKEDGFNRVYFEKRLKPET
ncbi:GNAT family N-acetyltransferase [Roseobacteraceae bacterium S113]